MHVRQIVDISIVVICITLEYCCSAPDVSDHFQTTGKMQNGWVGSASILGAGGQKGQKGCFWHFLQFSSHSDLTRCLWCQSRPLLLQLGEVSCTTIKRAALIDI